MKKTLALLTLLGTLISPARAVGEEIAKNDLLKYAEYTANFEGRKSKVYDPNPNDGKEEPTIGVGHYLNRADSRKTFAKFLPEVNYEAIYSGKQELTQKQINRLFEADLSKYVNLAKSYFPQFDSYPLDLRQALVDGCYRGDISDSPKTRKLINEGKFFNAALEYTNRKDFKEASSKKMTGIIKRMQTNRAAMVRYSKKK